MGIIVHVCECVGCVEEPCPCPAATARFCLQPASAWWGARLAALPGSSPHALLNAMVLVPLRLPGPNLALRSNQSACAMLHATPKHRLRTCSMLVCGKPPHQQLKQGLSPLLIHALAVGGHGMGCTWSRGICKGCKSVCQILTASLGKLPL
jgi:hypothetical protein